MASDEELADLVLTPPLDASIFKFPAALAGMMLGGSIFFLLGAVSAIILQLVRPGRDSLVVAIGGVVFFGSFATLGLRSYGRLRDRVAVNSQGIWYLPFKGTATYIPWSNVEHVDARDTAQRLVLTGVGTGKNIKLEYQLEDFASYAILFLLIHRLKRVYPRALQMSSTVYGSTR